MLCDTSDNGKARKAMFGYEGYGSNNGALNLVAVVVAGD